MEIDKISIVGQFMVPRHQDGNGKPRVALINSEEILRFALLHHGFGIQNLEYIANKDFSVSKETKLFDVRVDLVKKNGTKVTLSDINDFLVEHNIRFIGNFFIESNI